MATGAADKNLQLNSENGLVEALIRQCKGIHIRRAGTSMHNSRLPVGVIHPHIAKSVGLARIRVEPRAPCQGRVRAAPSTAKVPRARAAVEHVLVHAAAVGGLKSRPEVVCGCSRQGGDHHRPRKLSEVCPRGRIIGQEIPGDGGDGVKEGQEGERDGEFGKHLGGCSFWRQRQ